MTSLIKSIILIVSMIFAVGLAWAIKPTTMLSEIDGRIDLVAQIPTEFGEWEVDNSTVPIQISPETAATLDAVYDQTLSRTYRNQRGELVMLSIAYGGQQNRSLQLHRPEVCYVAQGFQVTAKRSSAIQVQGAPLPVVRLVSVLGSRNEPITYWMKIGEHIALTGIDQALARYSYGVKGIIPDGVLVRISSISSDTEAAFSLQAAFARQMLQALPPALVARIAAGVKSDGA